MPEGIEAAGEVLRRAGFRVVRGDRGLYAVRNRLSPAATLVFHLSFLLVLLGGTASAWTRFSATALLAEGEPFDGATGPYVAPPALRRFGRPPEVRFVVEKIASVAEGLTPVDITARVVASSGRRFDARVNVPFKADHTSFVILDLGVAPLLILRDPSGLERDGAFVKLLLGRERPEPFVLGGIPMEARFFTDYAVEGGRPVSLSKEFRNPVLLLKTSGGQGGSSAPARPLRPGESLALAGGTVTFQELRYAVKFFVRRERGVGLVYAGFILACAALVARLFFYRREYAVGEVEGSQGTRIEIGGRSEFYGALFEEEFDRMVAAMEIRWAAPRGESRPGETA